MATSKLSSFTTLLAFGARPPPELEHRLRTLAMWESTRVQTWEPRSSKGNTQWQSKNVKVSDNSTINWQNQTAMAVFFMETWHATNPVLNSYVMCLQSFTSCMLANRVTHWITNLGHSHNAVGHIATWHVDFRARPKKTTWILVRCHLGKVFCMQSASRKEREGGKSRDSDITKLLVNHHICFLMKPASIHQKRIGTNIAPANNHHIFVWWKWPAFIKKDRH